MNTKNVLLFVVASLMLMSLKTLAQPLLSVNPDAAVVDHQQAPTINVWLSQPVAPSFGVTVHYNSAVVQRIDVSPSSIAGGLLNASGVIPIEDDSVDDLDNNPSTDKRIRLAWFDLMGQWQASQLFTMSVEIVQGGQLNDDKLTVLPIANINQHNVQPVIIPLITRRQ